MIILNDVIKKYGKLRSIPVIGCNRRSVGVLSGFERRIKLAKEKAAERKQQEGLLGKGLTGQFNEATRRCMVSVSPLRMVLILVAMLSNAGCTSSRQISLEILPGQAEHYVKGIHIVGSLEQNTFIAMCSLSKSVKIKGRAGFNVAFRNIGTEPAVFSIENIKAVILNDAEEIPLQAKIYSYDELVSEIEETASISAVFAGLKYLGNMSAASKAGYSRTTGSFAGAEGYGTYSKTTYDPAAEQAARDTADQKVQSDLSEIEHEKQRSISSLSSILRKSTVLPGKVLSGEIRVAVPKEVDESASLMFVIDAAGDRHFFKFRLNEMDK